MGGPGGPGQGTDVIAEGNPDFYGDTVRHLLRDGTLTTTMDILVVCGGETDRAVLADSGFRHVVISNLDPGPDPDAFAPFTWSHRDAERLGFPDGSFDFCVVHSGLHHCHAPHLALLEMYRVARKGLLLFEPYDNLLTRVGVRLNIGQECEHASVFYNGCARGGVGNSAIPNHVYRWTERESSRRSAATPRTRGTRSSSSTGPGSRGGSAPATPTPGQPGGPATVRRTRLRSGHRAAGLVAFRPHGRNATNPARRWSAYPPWIR